MEICIKVHETAEGTVLAACDSEILSNCYEEGELRLKINEDFYYEKSITVDEFLQSVESCFTANLAGEKTVNAFCRNNPEDRGSVIRIDGIPHLQIFRL
jgi:hypothetical protein